MKWRLLSAPRIIVKSLLVLSIMLHPEIASGWHDETHLAVAKLAGYYKWYNAVGADMAKIKADRIERNNHYFNNTKRVEVTPRMVFEQARRYNDPKDTEGHLYGAILASLREYKKTKLGGKYAEYHLAFSAHYVGDLSQPLHNYPYDDFNKMYHSAYDGVVEKEVLQNISKIEKHMYPIRLRSQYFEKDLAREISRIANISRKLAYKLQKERRDMTKEEAYRQLGHSASLLKAIIQ